MSGQAAVFPKFRQKNTEIEVWNGFESNLALPNILLFGNFNR